MTNLEKCPHCGKEFDATEALEKCLKRKFEKLVICCGRCNKLFSMNKFGKIAKHKKIMTLKQYNEMQEAAR